MLQILADLHAAAACVADDVDILVRIDFLDATRNLAHWDMGRALRALHRPLVILADINELCAFWYFSWLNVFHASYPSHA